MAQIRDISKRTACRHHRDGESGDLRPEWIAGT